MMKNYKFVIAACFALCMQSSVVTGQNERIAKIEQLEQDTNQLIAAENQRAPEQQVTFKVDQAAEYQEKIAQARGAFGVPIIDDNGQRADKLIAAGYFSPREQYAVLALFDRSLVLDQHIGLTPQLPSVPEIIARIDLMHQKAMAIDDLAVRKLAQERMKQVVMQALQATLQAIDIAVFAQSLQAAYQDTVSLIAPKVDSIVYDQLVAYKKMVQIALLKVTKTVSWKEYVASYFAPVHSLPDDLQQIFVHNDYQQVKNDASGGLAANLLFKQIVMTQGYLQSFTSFLQQHGVDLTLHTRDANWYSSMPDLDRYLLIFTYAASSIGNNPDKMHELHELHQVIIAVRKAVQVALFVANKNAPMNIAGLLPVSMTSLLDRITKQLLKYDQQLDAMCKDQRFGATQDDFYRDKVWSAISSLASGVALAGLGAAVWYDAAGMRSAMVGDGALAVIQDLINDPQKNMYNFSKKAVNSGIQYGVEFYKQLHDQPVGQDGQSFIDPETTKSINTAISLGLQDVAPIAINSLTSTEKWQDPKTQEASEALMKTVGNIASQKIKEGARYEALKVVNSPIVSMQDTITRFFNYGSSLPEPESVVSQSSISSGQSVPAA